MKKMRNGKTGLLLSLVLVLALALGLCACGASGTTAPAGGQEAAGNAPAETAPAEEAPAPAEGESAEGESAEGEAAAEFTTIVPGKLTMATSPDFPPYEFRDDAGQPTGIELELMAIIAEKLGLELQVDTMEFDSALMSVEQHKCDMAVSGITVREDRKLVMNFTDSYTTAVQAIVVPEGSEVTLETLGDYLIGTQRGTTGFIYCVDDYGEDHVIGYDTYSTVFQALLNGQIDCIVVDDSVAKAYVAQNPTLTMLDTEYAVEEYALAVDKDNEPLLAAVNAVLNELMADGTVQGIIDRYITD